MADTTTPEQRGLAPMAKTRITERLDAQELRYLLDEDGDVAGYWDGHLFYFFVYGDAEQVFQVRGRWNRSVGPDQLGALVRLANEWNSQRLWPKAFVREEEGELGVYGELTVDYADGVSDAQLDRHISCAVATTVGLFQQLDELFPEAAAEAKAKLGQG
jgi:hypothetical protein